MELSPRKISHDLIEWRSRLEGPDGLLLLLILMFLCSGKVKGENKGDSILVLGGKGRGESRGTVDGPHAVEGLVNHCGWETAVEEEGAHIGSTTLESGIIGTDAAVAKELRERNGVLTGCKVKRAVVQVAVGVSGLIMDIGLSLSTP